MRSLHTALLITGLAIASSNAHSDNKLVKVGNIIVPPTFATLLSEGMPLPVYLVIDDDESLATNDKVANAIIQLKGNKVALLGVDFSENTTKATIKPEFIEQTQKITEKVFSDDGVIVIGDGSSITLDFAKLDLKIKIPKDYFLAKKINRIDEIGLSSTDKFTGTASYNFALSAINLNDSLSSDSLNNYLNINTVFGKGINHFNLDTSFYGVGTSNHSQDIHRAMFERDYQGHRLSVGMLSGWDLQSLGQVSAVNANRIYGASFGNQSNSKVFDRSLSLTPIYAFLPSEGEVRILKEGKLVSIQNLPIGSHELNTKGLPSGIYDVEVEVYIDGKLVSANRQRVNKTIISNRDSGELQWQIWGGAVEPGERSRENKKNLPQMTHLIGLSMANRFDDLYLSGSAYLYNDIGVLESNLVYRLNDYVDFTLSTLNATDSSWRIVGNSNIRLADYGSIWFNYEKSKLDEKVYMYASDNYSFGASINLSKWIYKGGTISFSKRINRVMDTDSTNIDYYQHIYSGDYGTLSLRASFQEEMGGYYGYSDKSIAIDYSIPFGNMVSFGISRDHRGNTTADIGASKRFDSGIIRYAGLNVSRVIDSKNDSIGNFSASGNINYQGKYNQGNVSFNRTSNGDWGGNLVSQGSIGFSANSISASSRNGNAGIIVDTGMGGDANMIAKVNNSEITLTGGKNYIPVTAYQRYTVELMNSRNTRDSYEFDTSKKSLTLYPGNVAVMDLKNEVKELVTVFGIIKAEDGSIMANARVNNHIGATVTSSEGEFVLDVDKRYPTVMFTADGGQYCEASIDIRRIRGAGWVGDVICKGLITYAAN